MHCDTQEDLMNMKQRKVSSLRLVCKIELNYLRLSLSFKMEDNNYGNMNKTVY